MHKTWLAVLLLFTSVAGAQSVEEVFEQFGVESFEADDRTGPLLLWLPNEHGFWGAEAELAAMLPALGVSAWLVDLHSGAFAVPGGGSLQQFDNDDLHALLTLATAGGRPVYLLSSGRGASFTLRLALRWHANAAHPPLAGALLLSPNLAADRAVIGEEMRFDTVVGAHRLPIYVLQPQRSGKRWRLPQVAAALGAGGSAVYLRVLPGLRDGYQGDPRVNDPQEVAQRLKLPRLLRSAMRSLAKHQGWEQAPVTAQALAAALPRSEPTTGLEPMSPSPAPGLRLPLLDGEEQALTDYAGKVVLVSFWATWCPPCVEEMPSLNRLAREFESQGFVVLGVDIGEEPRVVREFLQRVAVDFPILMDPEAASVPAWKVHGFPTSYVVDRQGRIRLGYIGALDWQRPENSGPIQDILNE